MVLNAFYQICLQIVGNDCYFRNVENLSGKIQGER